MLNIDTRIINRKTPGRLDADELYLMLQITGYINESRICWPSLPTLSADCGWSEDKVKQVRARLIEKNFLSIVRSGNGRKSTVYEIGTAQLGLYLGGGKKSPPEKSPLAEGGKNNPSGGVENQPEVLGIEALGIEALVRLRETWHENIFEKLQWMFFPQKNGATEIELNKQTKILLDFYEKNFKGGAPEFRENFYSEHNYFLEADQQIEAYHDWYYLKKIEPVRVPNKVAEFITAHDWCDKLLKLIAEIKYDPMEEDDVQSSWVFHAVYETGTYYRHKLTNETII